jgi:hypothetical protein
MSDRRNKKVLEYANKILNDKESYGKKIELIDKFAEKEIRISKIYQLENDNKIIKRLTKIRRLIEKGKYTDNPYVTRSIYGRFIDEVMEPEFSFDSKFRRIKTVKQMEEAFKKFAKNYEIEDKEYKEKTRNLAKIIRLETDGLDPESVIKSKAILPSVYRRNNQNKELIKDIIIKGERNHFSLLSYYKLQEIYEDLVHKSNTEQRENDEDIYDYLKRMEYAVIRREGYSWDIVKYKRLNVDDYEFFVNQVFPFVPLDGIVDRKVKYINTYLTMLHMFMVKTIEQDNNNLINYVNSLQSTTLTENELEVLKKECMNLLKNNKGKFGHLYDIAVNIVGDRATSNYIPKNNKVENDEVDKLPALPQILRK